MLATRSALIVTNSDRAIAESIVTLPVLAYEAAAVDSEIRHIQAEWKINAVRSVARAVRNAAVGAAEAVVETVDREMWSGRGRVMRNCVRAMFSSRGC